MRATGTQVCICRRGHRRRSFVQYELSEIVARRGCIRAGAMKAMAGDVWRRRFDGNELDGCLPRAGAVTPSPVCRLVSSGCPSIRSAGQPPARLLLREVLPGRVPYPHLIAGVRVEAMEDIAQRLAATTVAGTVDAAAAAIVRSATAIRDTGAVSSASAGMGTAVLRKGR